MMRWGSDERALGFNALAHLFGGKRGFIHAFRHSASALCGGLSEFRAVDWASVSRLVFICKGNICRSAFAEAIARSLGAHAASAGLAGDPGKPADPRAVIAALRVDVDLSRHTSNSLTSLGLRDGDLLIAFEPSHARTLRAIAINRGGVQVTLLGLWHQTGLWPYIHDPYGLSDHYFNRCFGRIQRSLPGLLACCRASGASIRDDRR